MSPVPASLGFPEPFVFGISTSAHQFEGGLENNNWADWERKGRIYTGDRSGAACNWWNSADDDFDRAREMGVHALRLSVEWSRIEPTPGGWDHAALDRYRALLGGLKDRGIEPWLCLHHFTNPAWFEAKGGFANPESADRFKRFTDKVVDALGDLVRYWVTFNEPNAYAVMGWMAGQFPPGKQGAFREMMRVLTGIAWSHAQAYRQIKQKYPSSVVGLTQNCFAFAPLDDASSVARWVAQAQERLFVDTYLDALITGQVPLPFRPFARNVKAVQGTMDYLGLNIYGRLFTDLRGKDVAERFAPKPAPSSLRAGDAGSKSHFGEVWPGAISHFAKRFSRYGLPIYILENGVPDREDRVRPWLIAHVAREIHQLLKEGIDIRGYFHWSLVDNFEWAEGWGLRFGLYELDLQTKERRLRDSGRLYGALARNRELRREDVERYAPAAAGEIFPEPAPAKAAG